MEKLARLRVVIGSSRGREEALEGVAMVARMSLPDRSLGDGIVRRQACSGEAAVVREQFEADVWRRGDGVSRERLWWRRWRGGAEVRGTPPMERAHACTRRQA